MLGVQPRLGEVGVGVLQHGVLVAMAKLLLESNVSRRFVVFGFECAFAVS